MAATHAERVAALAPRINGRWTLDHKRSDKMAPLLKELGAPWIAQKAVDHLTPRWLIELTAEALHQTIEGLRTVKNVNTFGGPSPYTMGDGKVAPATVELVDECLLLVVKHPERGDICTRFTLEGDATLVAVMVVTRQDSTKLEVRRVFERKA